MPSKKQVLNALVKYIQNHINDIAEYLYEEVYNNKPPSNKNTAYVSVPDGRETKVQKATVEKKEPTGEFKIVEGKRGGRAIISLGGPDVE